MKKKSKETNLKRKKKARPPEKVERLVRVRMEDSMVALPCRRVLVELKLVL